MLIVPGRSLVVIKTIIFFEQLSKIAQNLASIIINIQKIVFYFENASR